MRVNAQSARFLHEQRCRNTVLCWRSAESPLYRIKYNVWRYANEIILHGVEDPQSASNEKTPSPPQTCGGERGREKEVLFLSDDLGQSITQFEICNSQFSIPNPNQMVGWTLDKLAAHAFVRITPTPQAALSSLLRRESTNANTQLPNFKSALGLRGRRISFDQPPSSVCSLVQSGRAARRHLRFMLSYKASARRPVSVSCAPPPPFLHAPC